MTPEQKRIAELEKQLAEAKTPTGFKIKIGNKQNVSVYGLGQRFPTTLYASGWKILIDNIDKVAEFLEENHDKLSWGK